MTLTRLLARPMLASTFLIGGISAIKHADQLAVRAKPVTDKVVPLAQRIAPQVPIPTDAKTLVRANGVVHVVGGLMLATGKAPRLAALVLLGTLVPTTMAGHRYWEELDHQAKSEQRTLFFKNVTAAGGLLLAAVDTEGRSGLVWRARRAARDAKREAKLARKNAKRQSKLVAKSARAELPFG
jgi:putative oxidoreductase